MKIDYSYKSYVLREHSELITLTKQCSKYDYALSMLNTYGVVSHILKHNEGDLMPLGELNTLCNDKGLSKEFKECLKINDASYHRAKRLKDRVEAMLLNGDCLFLTLTFTDTTLANSTEKVRRVAVSRFLKQFGVPYVANIDFGSKNNREHYHAIINASNIDLSSWRKYGNINAQRVRNRNIERDSIRLSKYVAKLSNHAIKETTKRSCLIYSR